tara:strand:+ start:12075 stop:13310 length:1236 start_codon:yes stop_codon:yes gene_type:complete
MTSIQLGYGDFKRAYAQEPDVLLLNRFFEVDPSNQVEGAALLARPGSKFFLGAGAGKMRRLAHQPGIFNGDLFVVSGSNLYRYDGTTVTAISGFVAGTGTPSITFVAGAGYEHMFIADGLNLQYYNGDGASSDVLTLTGAITATETITVDGVYYEYTAGSVDAGTPAGTVGSPYLVAMGADAETSLANTIKALNLSGIAGGDYSTATVLNANVAGITSTAEAMLVNARITGAAGDAILVAEAGADMSWATPNLEGGGTQSLNGVVTPDDVSMISLGTLNSFVLSVVAASQRFYWIRPGEVTIDALDFAEAESEPDEIIEVVVVGDTAWFTGGSSTEPWYATGDIDPTASQFRPQKGLAFSQGALEGTIVPIRNQIVVVAEDGIVYEIVGGVNRISNNSVEERIRVSRAAQA